MNRSHFFFVRTQKIYLFFILLFIISFYSCKKDGELSPDFDSANVVVQFTDTLSIETTLVRADSIQTDGADIYLLGLYHDPIFGIRSSSIYTNIALSGTSTDFGSGFDIDSVVLTLEYAGLYGDSNSAMSVNVYELSSTLDKNKTYYSNDTSAYSTLLKSITFTPKTTNNVLTLVDSVMHPPHLRIKLDESGFISKLKAHPTFNNNTELNDVINGFYITTTNSVINNSLLSGEGAIAYFNMNSPLSTVTVYYKNSTADSLQENFLIDASVKKFSHFSHNYTGTDIEKHLTNSASKDNTVGYVSSMAGVKTKLYVPYLKTLLKDGNVIINKAELVIPLAVNTIGNNDNPATVMGLAGINEFGTAVFIPDDYLGYCGCLNTSTSTYTFDVSRYIHQLLYETPTDYGMYLMARGSAVNANRIVFGTKNNTFSPIKLNITYSKID